jgi:endonuclease/exonuclease/phosphatase family metal-dependent hydrolase
VFTLLVNASSCPGDAARTRDLGPAAAEHPPFSADISVCTALRVSDMACPLGCREKEVRDKEVAADMHVTELAHGAKRCTLAVLALVITVGWTPTTAVVSAAEPIPPESYTPIPAASTTHLSRPAAPEHAVSRSASRGRAVVVSSFNVLAHRHTSAGGAHPGMASGPTRIRWTLELLRRRGVDVVGLQEFQQVQARVFRRHANRQFRFFPGPQARREVENAIAWRTDTWQRVAHRFNRVPYFGGRMVRMPMVLLRHRSSNAMAWFLNYHNPATTKRHPGNEHWRDVATRREIRLVRRLRAQGHPIIVTGDMNERREIFCKFTVKRTLQAANGGSHARGRCRPPQRMRVDWIFGTRRVEFNRYADLQGPSVRRISDHAMIVTRARIPR